MVQPFRGGTQWKKVRSLGVCLEGDIGNPGFSSPFASRPLSAMMVCLTTILKQWSQPTMDPEPLKP
jgi:hypothetical protein